MIVILINAWLIGILVTYVIDWLCYLLFIVWANMVIKQISIAAPSKEAWHKVKDGIDVHAKVPRINLFTWPLQVLPLMQSIYKYIVEIMKIPFLRSFVVRLIISHVVMLLLFYLFCVNWIEPTQIGIAKNLFTKRVWTLDGGIHFGAPWVLVSRVDTRPVRVSVNSAGRGTNSKLVQFNPKYWQEFINVEGWHYYWWANRFSFNFGYHEEHRGWKDIMRGYAYNAKQYPFIMVLEEYKETK